jgi:hypothetical protein
LQSYTTLQELGYVRAESKAWNPRHESWLLNAVYCEAKDPIIDFTNKVNTRQSAFYSCLQAGPMLVFEGKALLQDPEAPVAGTELTAATIESRKNYIELIQQHIILCKKGSILVIAYAEKASLRQLAHILSKGQEGSIFDCDRAMRLPNGGLLFQDKVYGEDRAYRPNAIVVLQK